MKSKRWGFAAITAAIVATFCVVGPAAAHADPSGPSVMSVDRSGAQPVVTIDWGANADAPVGVLESVDGYKLGTPADMATVVDDWGTSPGLRSYRAAACYSNCDLDSIKAGSATLVQGDWLRPDVGEAVNQPGPDVAAYWYHNGFVANLLPSADSDAPAFVLVRNGVPVAVTAAQASSVVDNGPFDGTVHYRALACYSDCTAPAVKSGFAQTTAPGDELTFAPAASPIPTTLEVGNCSRIEVAYRVNCTANVYNAVYALSPPTGGVESHVDGTSTMNSTCNAAPSCELSMWMAPGSGGQRDVLFTYYGDGDHSSSTQQQTWTVLPRRSALYMWCPDRGGQDQLLTCYASPYDDEGDVYSNTPVVGSVTMQSDVPGSTSATCPIDSLSSSSYACALTIALPAGTTGPTTLTATYNPDADHSGSAVSNTIDIVPASSRTSVSCTPDVVAVNGALTCTAKVIDGSTGSPPPPLTMLFFFDSPDLRPSFCTTDDEGTCTVTVYPPASAVGTLHVGAEANGYFFFGSSESNTAVSVRRPTALVAKPAIANLVSPTKVNLKMSATLTDALDHTPITGETVRFVVNGTTLCTGVTDASGVATCSGLTSVAQAANGYKAIFDGSASTYRLKTSTSGAGVRL